MANNHHPLTLAAGTLAGLAWTADLAALLSLAERMGFAVVSGVLVTASWSGMKLLWHYFQKRRKVHHKRKP